MQWRKLLLLLSLTSCPLLPSFSFLFSPFPIWISLFWQEGGSKKRENYGSGFNAGLEFLQGENLKKKRRRRGNFDCFSSFLKSLVYQSSRHSQRKAKRRSVLLSLELKNLPNRACNRPCISSGRLSVCIFFSLNF